MSETRPCLEVTAAVIFEKGRYLITLRPPDTHCGALWEFPGGKLQPGETLESCLRREIREELGIEIAVEEQLDEIAHSYPERDVQLHFFRCRRLSGEPQALGCRGFRWVAPHEFADYAFPEADARLLDKLIRSQSL